MSKYKLPASYLHTSEISLFCQVCQIPKRNEIIIQRLCVASVLRVYIRLYVYGNLKIGNILRLALENNQKEGKEEEEEEGKIQIEFIQFCVCFCRYFIDHFYYLTNRKVTMIYLPLCRSMIDLASSMFYIYCREKY